MQQGSPDLSNLMCTGTEHVLDMSQSVGFCTIAVHLAADQSGSWGMCSRLAVLRAELRLVPYCIRRCTCNGLQ